MSLSKKIKIARRFLKSIRIDSDLGDAKALEGFVCPQSSAEILLTMARHSAEVGQGAFTWTGPYGSGKSSLVVALSALLNGDYELQNQAAKLFGRKLTNTVTKAYPPNSKGWRILPVVGRRIDPVQAIGEGLIENELVTRRPRGGWSEDKLISSILEVASRNPRSHGGLILFVDEMGKFLEAAAHDGKDIYIFQQLAEAAARSNGRLLVIGILHQAFEEYAHRLSHEIRDEWAKIQGRFVDLAVNVAGDEQIELLSRAIESAEKPKSPGKLAKSISSLIYRDKSGNSEAFALTLEHCWPLHPVTASLLGPISRRRFGQNQRSIFGFLNSAEPHGFQDFIRTAGDEDLFYPYQLWNYLRANLEPSILASPDGHRWALAAEALERCESIGGDALHINLLKTIAVIDLFKERSGLIASNELLLASLPNCTKAKLESALEQLDKWSFTIYKKFLGAHAIFAGSDFDIDIAVKSALDDITDIDFSHLATLAGLQPILAKRHYHETGSMRWFDINLAPLNEIDEIAAHYRPSNGAVGQFLLAIPTEGEEEKHAHDHCRKAARHSDEWDVVVGISKRSWAIVTFARELLALERVRSDSPELAGDSVARREIDARLAALQGHLETELYRAFDSAVWFRKNFEPKSYRQSDLNVIASEMADRRFEQCPRLHNELLNRQKPSSSAIAAQNILLRRMVLNEGDERLGIEGFPAEGGLFASVLEATNIYLKQKGRWKFAAPDENNASRLAPAWQVALAYVKDNADRPISLSELYEIWRKPPYGMKDGLMPVLAVSFILSQRNEISIYREGIFRAKFDDVDVEYLSNDPSSLQVRWMDLSTISRRLLSEMAEVVRTLDGKNELVNLEPIDVARGLVSIYEGLPEWTKRTMQLSANAVNVRDLFKRAKDPNKFLFDDIPTLLSSGKDLKSEHGLHRIVESVRAGLQELVDAYPSMLRRMRDLMLVELQVPNLSPQSLAELQERAENIKRLAGDFRLEAFVGRLSQFDGGDASFEGIASLAANKPPRDWVDPDMDRAAIDLADMGQKFLRAETYARVKGRPAKRHAMAVLVGINGKPSPMHEEFDLLDSDRGAVNELIERVEAALDQSDTKQRSLILAALAELSARYMNPISKSNGKRKEEVVSS